MTTPKRPKLTVYQRILRASEAGHGIRLSVGDCEELMDDNAILTRAILDEAGKDSETE